MLCPSIPLQRFFLLQAVLMTLKCPLNNFFWMTLYLALHLIQNEFLPLFAVANIIYTSVLNHYRLEILPLATIWTKTLICAPSAQSGNMIKRIAQQRMPKQLQPFVLHLEIWNWTRNAQRKQLKKVSTWWNQLLSSKYVNCVQTFVKTCYHVILHVFKRW